MKGSLVALVTVIPLLLWPAAESAAGGGSQARKLEFIGLWEGVDPADGSLTQRSITCDDGACRVLGSDQFFSFCQSSDGRGLLAGTGAVADGVLAVPDFSLTCADGTATPEFFTRFTLDRRNGTLIEDTDGPPPTITFHRLSAPVVRGRR